MGEGRSPSWGGDKTAKGHLNHPSPWPARAKQEKDGRCWLLHKHLFVKKTRPKQTPAPPLPAGQRSAPRSAPRGAEPARGLRLPGSRPCAPPGRSTSRGCRRLCGGKKTSGTPCHAGTTASEQGPSGGDGEEPAGWWLRGSGHGGKWGRDLGTCGEAGSEQALREQHLSSCIFFSLSSVMRWLRRRASSCSRWNSSKAAARSCARRCRHSCIWRRTSPAWARCRAAFRAASAFSFSICSCWALRARSPLPRVLRPPARLGFLAPRPLAIAT